jgi:hypothetical protein
MLKCCRIGAFRKGRGIVVFGNTHVGPKLRPKVLSGHTMPPIANR